MIRDCAVGAGSYSFNTPIVLTHGIAWCLAAALLKIRCGELACCCARYWRSILFKGFAQLLVVAEISLERCRSWCRSKHFRVLRVALQQLVVPPARARRAGRTPRVLGPYCERCIAHLYMLLSARPAYSSNLNMSLDHALGGRAARGKLEATCAMECWISSPKSIWTMSDRTRYLLGPLHQLSVEWFS